MKYGILAVVLAAVLIAGCVGQTPASPSTTFPGENQTAVTTTPIYPYETSPGTPILEILSPTSGQDIAGIAVGWRINVTNFRLISTGSNVPNRPNEGHLDATLDSRPIQHTFEKSGSFVGVDAGQHTLRIELVNNDHTPLSPAIVQAVTFTTSAS